MVRHGEEEKGRFMPTAQVALIVSGIASEGIGHEHDGAAKGCPPHITNTRGARRAMTLTYALPFVYSE